MQRSALISLAIPLIFGIPFLLITDFFPFHRYGMFARMPSEKPAPETRIVLAGSDTNIVLKTGSPALDRGLIARMAARGWQDAASAEVLLAKLRPSLNPFPDSVFLEQKQHSSAWKRKRIYP